MCGTLYRLSCARAGARFSNPNAPNNAPMPCGTSNALFARAMGGRGKEQDYGRTKFWANAFAQAWARRSHGSIGHRGSMPRRKARARPRQWRSPRRSSGNQSIEGGRLPLNPRRRRRRFPRPTDTRSRLKGLAPRASKNPETKQLKKLIKILSISKLSPGLVV